MIETKSQMILSSKIYKIFCHVFLAHLLLIGECLAQRDDPESLAAPEPDLSRPQESYAPFPDPDAGYVSDHARLLGVDAEEKIEQWLWQTESKTGVEIIVVTIDSINDYPGTPNRHIGQFASALFDAYGIGNLPANDGVLLLVAVKDRKAKIELGAGYGRRRDSDARRIMSQVIVPQFKKTDYVAGITGGVEEIISEFAEVRIGINWPLITLIITVPILLLIIFSLFKNGKKGWGWVVIGLLLVILSAIIYMVRSSLRHMPGSSSGSWSSGGLGGFGGGFSGGGGAIGSW
ncbi:MAG: TPM domain-containing protein [Desulfobacterales bacterium]|jgi:uncharacterized protein